MCGFCLEISDMYIKFLMWWNVIYSLIGFLMMLLFWVSIRLCVLLKRFKSFDEVVVIWFVWFFIVNVEVESVLVGLVFNMVGLLILFVDVVFVVVVVLINLSNNRLLLNSL